jgi:hypothetical protein
MKMVFATLVALLFLAPLVYADNAIFEIKAYIDDDSFDSDAYRQHGELEVVTKIKNISNHNQQFTILPYAYGASWSSSLPTVTPSETAMRKQYKPITLLPDEKYRKVLKVKVSPDITSGKVIFELGFDPQAKGVACAWSDDISFNISDEQLAAWRAERHSFTVNSVTDTGDKIILPGKRFGDHRHQEKLGQAR